MMVDGGRLSAKEKERSAEAGVERSSCGFQVNYVGVEH
jgi:hypothetical protein